ncbi:MAG TPA: carboxypeptidase regulatory-like domain-containing protein [Acidobacteriota bacterium]
MAYLKRLAATTAFIFCLLSAARIFIATPDLELRWPAARTAAAADTFDLKGKALFRGTVPDPVTLRMDADRNCAGQHQGPVQLQLVDTSSQGGLRNVFVYVKQGFEERRFQAPAEPVILDQKGCIYHPRVVGIQTGQRLKILNSDPTMHNVHPLPKLNQEWNLSQPPRGLPLVKNFDQPEVMVRVMCNIHPWMRAYIGVLPHPFYAVTSSDGVFEIRNLPPGQYTLEAWHEKLGTQQQKVTVGPKESPKVEFIFGQP